MLAANGKVVGIPSTSDAVLIIDPETNTADTATLTGIGTERPNYLGGVLASNGKIFGISFNADNVLLIDSGC